MSKARIKRTTIMRRWMINSLGVIVIILILFGAAFMLSVRANYYRRVETLLSSRADNMETYLTILNTAGQTAGAGLSPSSFSVRATVLAEGFEDKETLELQVLDPFGVPFVSSKGIIPANEGAPLDFYAACDNDSGRAVWSGRNAQGEYIMALSFLQRSDNGDIIGCLRFITSLEPVNARISLFVGIIALIGAVIIFFVMISSTYFINSIVRPIAEINRTARRIALGDYDARIEKFTNDEIGDLCDTINYMAGEIENTEQIKNDFISSVSHELRTPLTAIKGWAETLSLDAQENTLTEKGLGVIVNEAERLSGIVEELLDFSRMQIGHISMQMERIDLFAELSEAVVLLRDRAVREGVELELIDPGNIPLVLADPHRLKQVFINLIDNAVKYSNKGDRVRIEPADMDDYVQVVISDTGIGISPHDLPHIRDKFYKANTVRPGSGIGLALVDEIIRLHSGQMMIDSEEGAGTTVTLMLPAAPSN